MSLNTGHGDELILAKTSLLEEFCLSRQSGRLLVRDCLKMGDVKSTHEINECLEIELESMRLSTIWHVE